eukprot:gnl/MRDRNA2_/MRDRNA2_107465_c0_seq1.p1 gnl/MRDRNA2_/MRDRNA2_107465_c0~~gnl/MRDRNA2_/MRDRNA2_107465_c0_seq1.p1  ORF type:complete len:508 (+),score=106.34 gnl/MRDRNA2_/MRDRNA2_107465_c0_seq1:79-1602(+)
MWSKIASNLEERLEVFLHAFETGFCSCENIEVNSDHRRRIYSQSGHGIVASQQPPAPLPPNLPSVGNGVRLLPVIDEMRSDGANCLPPSQLPLAQEMHSKLIHQPLSGNTLDMSSDRRGWKPSSSSSCPPNLSAQIPELQLQSELRALGSQVEHLESELRAELRGTQSSHSEFAEASAAMQMQATTSMNAALAALSSQLNASQLHVAPWEHISKKDQLHSDSSRTIESMSTRRAGSTLRSRASTSRSRGSTHRLQEELDRRERQHEEAVAALKKQLADLEGHATTANVTGQSGAEVKESQKCLDQSAAQCFHIGDALEPEETKTLGFADLETHLHEMCRATDELHNMMQETGQASTRPAQDQVVAVEHAAELQLPNERHLQDRSSDVGTVRTDRSRRSNGSRRSCGSTESTSNRLREELRMCEQRYDERVRMLGSEVEELQSHLGQVENSEVSAATSGGPAGASNANASSTTNRVCAGLQAPEPLSTQLPRSESELKLLSCTGSCDS